MAPTSSSNAAAAAAAATAAANTANSSMLTAQLRDKSGVKFSSAAEADRAAIRALMTPPDSVSPNLPAQAVTSSSPPAHTLHDHDMHEDAMEIGDVGEGDEMLSTPLSKSALSGLDAAAVITPAMLAKHHLPGIMLGNGPRPIRYVMGELMRLVPGFSRIPPAKARRLVVAALESRSGGGVDGNVTFCKTGWGRWDAHIKGSSTKDSAIGSLQDSHLSPPRSEHSSFAAFSANFSANDSAVHIPKAKTAPSYRDRRSGGSWTTSSHRIEEEVDVDMDALENEADKMSLDGDSPRFEAPGSSSSDLDDETEDEDWAAVGADAVRKASLPAPGAPRRDYQAHSMPYSASRWPSTSWSRRPSGLSDRSRPSFDPSLEVCPISVPPGGKKSSPELTRLKQTPEEEAAIAALMSLGSV